MTCPVDCPLSFSMGPLDWSLRKSRWVLTFHHAEQETKLTHEAISGRKAFQIEVLDFQQVPCPQLPLSFLSRAPKGLPKGMETYNFSPYYLLWQAIETKSGCGLDFPINAKETRTLVVTCWSIGSPVTRSTQVQVFAPSGTHGWAAQRGELQYWAITLSSTAP